MNILLINVSMRPNSTKKLFPIGLAYVATSIKKAGFEFDLIDIDAHRLSDEEVTGKILSKPYDIVCMGCIVTGYRIIKELCRIIRAAHPKAKIIIGNSVATSIPDILLRNTSADIAVMSEGDEIIVKILKCIGSGVGLEDVPGICFKRGGGLIKTKNNKIIGNISSLPFIDFDIFDVQSYINASSHNVNDPNISCEIRALPVNTARGCIANCTFCYHVFKGVKYRHRTAESIVSEISRLISKYSLNYIQFWDELTFFSMKQANEIIDEIIKSGLVFKWTAQCRANLFSGPDGLYLAKKMKASGCCGMQYSLESASEEILKDMNKRISIEQFSQQTKILQSAGIPTWTSIVIGYPKETPETIKKTFNCCVENNIYPSTGYLLPQPGSIMYDYAIKNGFILDEERYLLTMGERQDLRLNMTKMEDEELEFCVIEGLKRCNKELSVGLKDEDLIKSHSFKSGKRI